MQVSLFGGLLFLLYWENLRHLLSKKKKSGEKDWVVLETTIQYLKPFEVHDGEHQFL